MFKLTEELLEPLARYFRFRTGTSEITKAKNVALYKEPLVIADLGCGPDFPFYRFCKRRGILIKEFIGIDPITGQDFLKFNNIKEDNIRLIQSSLIKKISLPDNSVDIVTAFAFIEHIDYPEDIIIEGVRILKKNGLFVITTPSLKAKSILEFLSFKLHMFSPDLVKEHKNYFSEDLVMKIKHNLLDSNKKVEITYQPFEFGLNNLIVIKKLT